MPPTKKCRLTYIYNAIKARSGAITLLTAFMALFYVCK